MSAPDAKRLLQGLFACGVDAASPARLVPAALADLRSPPSILLAAGKAAVEMAEAAADAGVRPRAGLVVTRQGQGRPLLGLEVIEAAHPRPDRSSQTAARRLLALARAAGQDDHVLLLLSGGASALLCAPSAGLTLQRKQALTDRLLASGATISEINAVRRHLSKIKGGRLARAAAPAMISTLAISDVVGDRPEDIGSGPSAGDPTTLAEAQEILHRYGLSPLAAGWSESLKPDDPELHRADYRIVGSAAQSHLAVREAARALRYEPVDLGEALEGEARDLGARHGELAQDYAHRGGRFALISGGELTVTVKGKGRGGPNFEYAAALAMAVKGAKGLIALAGDTDGIDGNSGACGAFVFGDTASRAASAGLALDLALEANDAASAFFRIGDVFAPGPTGTNVNDLRIILVGNSD